MASTKTYNNINLPYKFYGIVYIIANTKNRKVYLGKTSYSLRESWKTHLDLARKVRQLREENPHRKYYVSAFINALAYFDEDVWKMKVLDVASNKEELTELYTEYIKKYKATNSEKGYNKNLRRRI